MSGNIHKRTASLKQYFKLKEINEKLVQENAILMQNNKKALYKRSYDKITINDTIYNQKYLYSAAQVVNFSIHNPVNYIILDRGSKQGIKPQMGVITHDGLVGIVKDVSQNFCSVISLLNNKTELFAVLKRSGFTGRVKWEEEGQFTIRLYDVPKNIDVVEGDTVVTGRSSSIFPEGIKVGYVKEIIDAPGEPFYEIKLTPSVSFNNLSYVYVVENVLKEEQDAIKNKFLNSFN